MLDQMCLQNDLVREDREDFAWSVIRKITGESAILAHLTLLQNLAERYGQAGEVDQLAYHLSASLVRAKQPHLLLFETPNRTVCAAALVCEYKLGFLSSRIFFSLDFTGRRTVLAPPELRSTIAVAAADYLFRHGALLALLSVGDGEFEDALDTAALAGRRRFNHAILHRPIFDLWELGQDFDSTLRSLGHDTRRNFRRHPRNLEAECGTSFFPESDISEFEFLELNRVSSHPVSESIALWRFRAARRFADNHLAGVCDASGRWLSIAGLRSRHQLTDVDWQMNRVNLKGISLVTAMRSYLLRSELARGTRFLRFEGGTSHTMQSGFHQQRVSHVLLTRPLVSVALRLGIASHLFAPDNLLLNVVSAPQLTWSTGLAQKSQPQLEV